VGSTLALRKEKAPHSPPFAPTKILISCPKADQIDIPSSELRKNGTLIDRERQTDSHQDFRSSRHSQIINSIKSALMRDLNSKISVGSDGTKDKEKFAIPRGCFILPNVWPIRSSGKAQFPHLPPIRHGSEDEKIAHER